MGRGRPPVSPVLCVVLAFFAASSTASGPHDAPGPPHAEEHADVIHALANVIEIYPGLIIGSAPHGEAAFVELQRLGVRTIISVDGAEPDVTAARKAGMRYVHLPVGYRGIERERQLALARAVRDLPGPVYLHCHHGKHRGPAAGVSVGALLGQLTPDQGVKLLHQAGTSENYPGLFRCVGEARPATKDELAKMVRAMTQMQTVVDHLGQIRDAGWQVPSDHPDLVPLAEAGRLENLLRGLTEGSEAKNRSESFRDLAKQSWSESRELEIAIERKAKPDDLSKRLIAIKNSCNACHAAHRNH